MTAVRTILMIHNHYRSEAPSGENRSFEEEAAMLEQHGHRVIRYERTSDEIEAWSAPRRAAVAARAIWSREARREVTDLIARDRPDVAHVQNTFPLISASVYAACRDAGVPVVQSVRNYRFLCPSATMFRDGAPCHSCVGRTPLPAVRHGCYRGSRTASAAAAAMLAVHRARGTWTREVDVYVAPSQHVRSRLVEGGFPSGRIMVKPNVVMPDPGLGDHDGNFVLFAGRLDAEKGVDTLLEAWESLCGRVPLVIAGDGPMAPRVRDAAGRNAGISWLGRCTPHQTRDLLGAARAVVAPSKWEEPFGRVVAEAFARGTPVIASRIGGLAELVDDGVTGFTPEPGDAGALATAAEKLWSDPAAVAAMSRAARREYERRFAPAPNHDVLVGIYARALERAR